MNYIINLLSSFEVSVYFICNGKQTLSVDF